MVRPLKPILFISQGKSWHISSWPSVLNDKFKEWPSELNTILLGCEFKLNYKKLRAFGYTYILCFFVWLWQLLSVQSISLSRRHVNVLVARHSLPSRIFFRVSVPFFCGEQGPLFFFFVRNKGLCSFLMRRGREQKYLTFGPVWLSDRVRAHKKLRPITT